MEDLFELLYSLHVTPVRFFWLFSMRGYLEFSIIYAVHITGKVEGTDYHSTHFWNREEIRYSLIYSAREYLIESIFVNSGQPWDENSKTNIVYGNTQAVMTKMQQMQELPNAYPSSQ